MTHIHATQPSAAPQADSHIWAKVIGIISICFGGLGLLGGLWGLAFLFAPDAFPSSNVPRQIWVLPRAILAAGNAAILLSAGILTLRRRPSGRTLHLLYAVIAIILILMGIPFLIDQLSAPAPAGMEKSAAIGYRVGMGVSLYGTVVGLGYPGFLLVWFLRRTVREQVRTWRKPKPNQPFASI